MPRKHWIGTFLIESYLPPDQARGYSRDHELVLRPQYGSNLQSLADPQPVVSRVINLWLQTSRLDWLPTSRLKSGGRNSPLTGTKRDDFLLWYIFERAASVNFVSDENIDFDHTWKFPNPASSKRHRYSVSTFFLRFFCSILLPDKHGILFTQRNSNLL